MAVFIALIALVVLERRPVLRVRFWCGTAGRDVEVAYVGRIVRSCTASTTRR